MLLRHFFLLALFVSLGLYQVRCEDNEEDCYEALHSGHFIEQCILTAEHKWKLDGTSSIEASCCAIFEALNCAQNRSCLTCPLKDLHDWAQYRIRALTALGQTICTNTPYEKLAEKCNVTDKTPLVQHCDNEPMTSTEPSSFKSAIILGLVMLVVIILVAVLGLIVHLLAHDGKGHEHHNVPVLHSSSSGPVKFIAVTAPPPAARLKSLVVNSTSSLSNALDSKASSVASAVPPSKGLN